MHHADVTVGSWMLAFDVQHMDDRRLCEPWCSEHTLAVWHMPRCAGLCNPAEDLLNLHSSKDCRTPALETGYTELPKVEPIFQFS